MAHGRRYDEQLVIMAERAPATTVRAAAALYSQSEAQVLREAIDAGLPAVLRQYARRAGLTTEEAGAKLAEIGTEIEKRRAYLRAKREARKSSASTHS